MPLIISQVCESESVPMIRLWRRILEGLSGETLWEDLIFFNSHNEGWSPNWVHSARRPLNGLLYMSLVIMMMENLVEWRLAGETEVLGENLPQRHVVHRKSHLPDPDSNSGCRGGKPATNRLSYGAAERDLTYWMWIIRIVRNKSNYFMLLYLESICLLNEFAKHFSSSPIVVGKICSSFCGHMTPLLLFSYCTYHGPRTRNHALVVLSFAQLESVHPAGLP
jgi:hypothetical protein